ncbi:MAG: hypothetical protein KatS3mg015_2463 [Fimbriimonadales bacterium]|nr:MAG: hypothetical protein KatS3mg015_2463 [Fimbriimonadales bacterium]
MVRLRFCHDEHGRDNEDVERLVRWVVRDATPGNVPPLAVRIRKPAAHDYPSGCAYLTYWPQWAVKLYPRRSHLRRAMYAISVTTCSDAAPVLGQPHVCWHARAARTGATCDEDAAAYQPAAAAAWARGERQLGQWPIYILRDWREALVHTFAHELSHVVQFARNGGRSEIVCERFAAYVLERFRGDGRGR